jgi:acyl-CoA synthetase (AMP-forming)/AMP-acid ligase II
MTFAPNFLISKLAKDLSAKAPQFKGSFDLSSLKRINSGGEAVVTSTVKAFCEALNAVRAPGLDDLTVEIAAGFGMTETW